MPLTSLPPHVAQGLARIEKLWADLGFKPFDASNRAGLANRYREGCSLFTLEAGVYGAEKDAAWIRTKAGSQFAVVFGCRAKVEERAERGLEEAREAAIRRAADEAARSLPPPSHGELERELADMPIFVFDDAPADEPAKTPEVLRKLEQGMRLAWVEASGDVAKQRKIERQFRAAFGRPIVGET